MKRVAIIGSGGAGKSTLAREMGAKTGLPVIHLDREYWKPGWVESEPDEWSARVAELVATDEWITDGNYGGTLDLRLQRADTIIFLDLPRSLCVFRTLKRGLTYRNRSRPDMTPGCNERLEWQFLKWIWQYPTSRRPGILNRLRSERSAGKRIVRLRSTGQVRRFLVSLDVLRPTGVPG